MDVEAVALVLGEHHDASETTVDQVRQRKVDEPVLATMGNGGLRTNGGEGHESLPHPAGEHHGQDMRVVWLAEHAPILAHGSWSESANFVAAIEQVHCGHARRSITPPR